MRRVVKPLALILILALAIALYREWVIRNAPPLFIPLGFFESATEVITPEKRVSQPETWNDPLRSVTMDGDTFDELARTSNAEEKSIDVLIIGGTLGGTAALLAATGDGASAVLVSERDWREEMMTYAGLLLEEPSPPVESSAIEMEIRQYVARARGMPRDIVRYLEAHINSLPKDSVLSEYSVVALARDESGRLQRALIRSNDGTRTIAVRFTTIIDGTKEGTLMALAGIETRSGWDSDTGEPGALPAIAIDALANGYTMSGRTIEGIGRRLDGVRAQMGIIDRGYHGTFVAPSRIDDCWQRDTTSSPTIAKQAVMHAQSVGCSASFSFQSGFHDTVEVFYVNHSNEHVSATIRSGSGAPLSVEVLADPSTPFIRIGAFSVSNVLPLSIDVRSVLPTDRLEGLIVRKLNTGSAPAQQVLAPNSKFFYSAGPWQFTEHDIYVHQSGLDDPPTITVDGDIFPTHQIGRDTYAVRSVLIASGDHVITIAERMTEGFVSIVPVSPSVRSMETTIRPPTQQERSKGRTIWEFTPNRDGTIVITLPRRSCAKQCEYSLTESGSLNTLFSGSHTALGDLPFSAVLAGTATVVAGNTYAYSFHSDEDPHGTPTIAYHDQTAGLHEVGSDSVTLNTPTDGRMYDIWVRSPRSTTAQVTMRGATVEVDVRHGWTYAGTTIASADEISVRAGGFVEMFAIPNTSLDTYHLSLAPTESLSIGSGNLPSGVYDITAYSQTHPRAINVRGDDGTTVQHIAFDVAATSFTSQKPLIWHSSDSLLVSASEWPLQMIVHQTIAETSVVAPSNDTERPRFTILTKASGSMLLTPAPTGINPVTMGLLEHPYIDTLVRSNVDAAFARLHYAELPESCVGKNDPTCDARRYVRDPTILETNDSQSLHAVTTDGRRLVGIDTLTESGAFAIRTSCQPACNSICIAGTIENDSCLVNKKHSLSTANAIVAIRGSSELPSIMSNAETRYDTLPTLLFSLRRDGFLHAKETYLERSNDPRDFSLSLGMFLPPTDDNFLVANTTLSMTHIASRAMRSSSTELAIGSAIGHVAAFAALQERATPEFLLRSPEAMRRLQNHLIEKGIMVYPTFDIANDNLLMKSVQYRLSKGIGQTTIAWKNGSLTTLTTLSRDENEDSLRIRIFGDDTVRTVGQALLRMPGAPSSNDTVALLYFGIARGFITQKMLQISVREIMRLELDMNLLLKAEYLLHTDA